jgi:hypothetical protein
MSNTVGLMPSHITMSKLHLGVGYICISVHHIFYVTVDSIIVITLKRVANMRVMKVED